MEGGRVGGTAEGKRRRGTSVRPLYRTVPVRQAAPGMTGRPPRGRGDEEKKGHGAQGDTETRRHGDTVLAWSKPSGRAACRPVVLGPSRKARSSRECRGFSRGSLPAPSESNAIAGAGRRAEPTSEQARARATWGLSEKTPGPPHGACQQKTVVPCDRDPEGSRDLHRARAGGPVRLCAPESRLGGTAW
jgi:hypothetical protein